MDNPPPNILEQLQTGIFWFAAIVSTITSLIASYIYGWMRREGAIRGTHQASPVQVEASTSPIGPIVAIPLLTHAVLAGLSLMIVSITRRDDLKLSVFTAAASLIVPLAILWSGRTSRGVAIAQVILSVGTAFLVARMVAPSWVELMPVYGVITAAAWVVVVGYAEGYNFLMGKTGKSS
jgi:hypothetical protein